MTEQDNAFEDEVEPTVSIQELLKDAEEEELEADLVLGGDEGNDCTYNKGYLKRQAIFSCLTCTPDGNAGVCLACSLSCHDGHEVVELWTKRNFRCDCGNSRFGEIVCKLCPNKDIENVENSYNHNFKGSYCVCGRPYPDPNTEEQEEMMQCCICEDWFHEEHIGLESPDEIPKDEEGEPFYEDFICQACSAFCSFLALYPKSIWAAGSNTDKNTCKDKIVVEDTSSAAASGKVDNVDSPHDLCKIHQEPTDGGAENVPYGNTAPLGVISDKNVGSVQVAEDVGSGAICVIGVDLGVMPPTSEMRKPMFLSKNWRDSLCRCEKCVGYYRQKKMSFLLDKEDSMAEYEKTAKQKRKEKLQQQEDAELSFLNNLGHIEKIEILNGIADMRDGILSLLESSDPSKVLTPADVHRVFEDLAKKRRRIL